MVKRFFFLIILTLIILIAPVVASETYPFAPDGYQDFITGLEAPYIGQTAYYSTQELSYGGWNFYNEVEYGITSFRIWANSGESGNFTIYRYDNTSVNGWWVVTTISPFQYLVIFDLDGTTKVQYTIGLVGSVQIYGAALKETATNQTGLYLFYYTEGTGSSGVFKAMDFYEAPISGLSYTKNNANRIDIVYHTVDVAATGGGTTFWETVIGALNNTISFVVGFFLIIIGFFALLKFIFVDNFLLTISFYFLGTLALATASSQDAFTALKTWWEYQRKFFDFMVAMINGLISIAYYIKNTIPGLKWL